MSVDNREEYLGTSMFSKRLVTPTTNDFDGNLQVQLEKEVYVQYVEDALNMNFLQLVQPQKEPTPPDTIIRKYSPNTLISSSLGLITQPVRNQVQRITGVQTAKQKSGLKYLI